MVEFRQHNRITTTKLSTTYKHFSDKSKPTLDRITICSLYTKEVRSMKDIKVLFMPISEWERASVKYVNLVVVILTYLLVLISKGWKIKHQKSIKSIIVQLWRLVVILEWINPIYSCGYEMKTICLWPFCMYWFIFVLLLTTSAILSTLIAILITSVFHGTL